MEKNNLKKILRINQTVFSFKELSLIYRTTNTNALKSKLNYYQKNQDLYHIRRGLYAKNHDYNRLELATKILTPAYISFETVLNQAGIIFQYYQQIFVASYQSRNIICDQQVYTFRALKSQILTNSIGVEQKSTYCIASPERAFLDIIYRTKNYHFDNLDPLNWDKIYEILPIYQNTSMHKRIDKYHKEFKKNLATN